MNADFENAELCDVSIHQVGNNIDDNTLIISNEKVQVNAEAMHLLQKYFITSFDFSGSYSFCHDADLNLNEIYNYVNHIFDCRTDFHDYSTLIARHLHAKSSHQNIKTGELYIAYFTGCKLDDVFTDAIGIFKSETKESYLDVSLDATTYNVLGRQGININKLDKGCIVFNTDHENGNVVFVVDRAGKGNDAKYWMNEFLNVKSRQDQYNQTANFMSVCKRYLTKQLPAEFEVTKADQAELLNRSVQYLKDNEEFSIQEFSETVLEQPEVIESFINYREQNQAELDIRLEDSFSISSDAVKKQSRSFKSVIKLDKNFHIYVHGDRRMIEQGEDEKGRYYKVYFQEES
ncbi:MAG: nucleoid-associated protein [Bacteroidales bacterium]|nr:nucleoid-associated protein [Bacteroidales bacterium]